MSVCTSDTYLFVHKEKCLWNSVNLGGNHKNVYLEMGHNKQQKMKTLLKPTCQICSSKKQTNKLQNTCINNRAHCDIGVGMCLCVCA